MAVRPDRRPPDRRLNFQVISYGNRVVVGGEVPAVYTFRYPLASEHPEILQPGVIPENFAASVAVEDLLVRLRTRRSIGFGPECMIEFEVPNPDGGDRPFTPATFWWNSELEDLWIQAISHLEKGETHETPIKLTEVALDSLDTHPLVLFGIADPATQRALEKT
eukprot:UN0663